MTRGFGVLVYALPGASALLALGLFTFAGWNALQAGLLPELVSTALQAQPIWFCH